MTSDGVIAIIPARLASTRLPRKVILSETGKPLIQHVVEAARQCSAIDRVVVATDSTEVVEAVKKFSGDAVLTSPDCTCGTERVAEAALHFPRASLILNVQGDEPEMRPEPLEALVRGMQSRPQAVMGTIASPWPSDIPLSNTGAVKVVLNKNEEALYFSRSPIPHYRDGAPASPTAYLKHVGLYAFKPDFLQTYAALAPTPLEQAESLEQLRALESGHRIHVFIANYRGLEVNTPEDYASFVQRHRNA